MSTLKGKNLLPWKANSFLLEKTLFLYGQKESKRKEGSKLFSFRGDPISEGTTLVELSLLTVYQFHLRYVFFLP